MKSTKLWIKYMWSKYYRRRKVSLLSLIIPPNLLAFVYAPKNIKFRKKFCFYNFVFVFSLMVMTKLLLR
uniref:Uncharacterized protein n=1 Tax=Physcomitrium patens TaxID=3218 RepID=A0A2K1K7J8_PHYPA|nr:hypothetical protein PHYPA_011642 [Physcomitrium patens]